MLRSWVLKSFAALVFAGCSASTAPTADDVVLIPTKSLYVPGETVSAQLFNRSREEVGYGACDLRIEQLRGASWVLIGPEQLPCLDILYILGPESSRVMQLQLDPALESGSYRLRQEILPRTNPPARYIYSRDFRLRNAT